VVKLVAALCQLVEDADQVATHCSSSNSRKREKQKAAFTSSKQPCQPAVVAAAAFMQDKIGIEWVQGA
jgi:hypothetical protein